MGARKSVEDARRKNKSQRVHVDSVEEKEAEIASKNPCFSSETAYDLANRDSVARRLLNTERQITIPSLDTDDRGLTGTHLIMTMMLFLFALVTFHFRRSNAKRR